MTAKRVLKGIGIAAGILAVVIAAGAAYVSRTWDDARYADYPLPDLRATSDTSVIAHGR